MMKQMIAIDAGGTKTEAVLFSDDGTVIRRIRTHGINPLNSSFQAACDDCLDLLHTLNDFSGSGVSCAYVGMPASQYFGGRIERYVQQNAGIPHVRLEADGYMLISAMLGHADGAGLVCGTGSGLYVRSGDRQYSIGGWGYILDGCGSGFVLGRRALRAVIREADGRGEKTLMTELANRQMGAPVTEHLPELYAGGRPAFAAYARIVFEACKSGDREAERIFNDCADDLAEMVRTGHRKAPIQTLVLNGGIFMHFPEYRQALARRIPPEIRLIHSNVPPLYGAAAEAMHDAGYSPAPGFQTVFLSTLANAPGV